METNLEWLEPDLSDEEKPMFNVLKATLEYPANVQLKSARLVDDILFFCKAVEEPGKAVYILFHLWYLILNMASCIPPDHQWQKSLVQCLVMLMEREDTITGSATCKWKDLPDFDMVVRLHFDGMEPGCGVDESREDHERWKNFHAFLTRFIAAGYGGTFYFSTWLLRDILERDIHLEAPEMKYRLWVASEWILQCGDAIFKDIEWGQKQEELHADVRRALQGGPLCKGIEPLSAERWHFWQKRFSELAEVSGDAERVADVVQKMEEVEKSRSIHESDPRIETYTAPLTRSKRKENVK